MSKYEELPETILINNIGFNVICSLEDCKFFRPAIDEMWHSDIPNISNEFCSIIGRVAMAAVFLHFESMAPEIRDKEWHSILDYLKRREPTCCDLYDIRKLISDEAPNEQP